MIKLRPMTRADIPLFRSWLAADHVSRWYRDPEDWIAEAEDKDGLFGWISRFIAEEDGAPIGFCQYYKGSDSDEGWLALVKPEGVYSIDYLVGEVSALRRGCGGEIVRCLEREILRRGDALRIAVQPEKANTASRALLRSCGFVQTDAENGIYVKELSQ